MRLGDVVDTLTGFPFRSAEFVDQGIPLVRGDNVGQGRLRWDGVRCWPSHEAGKVAAYQLRVDDVILAMDRPWIEAGLKYAAVQPHEVPSLLVQRVARLRGTQTLDQRFLKYVIGQRAFTDYILSVQTGTTIPHISANQIGGYRLQLPPLEVQRTIASILGALDDKIELNRRMSRTLDEMAQAIFKSWFVDFERHEGPFVHSPVGRVPADWTVSTLGSVSEKPQYGYTESASLERVGPHFLRITDINKDPWIRWDAVPYCPCSRDDAEKHRLKRGDIVIARMADPGHGAYIEDEPSAVFASYLIRFRPRDDAIGRYLQYWLRSDKYWEFVHGRQGGSTRANLNAKMLADFPVLVPTRLMLMEFSRTVDALRARLGRAVSQAGRLAELRDALAVKLLAGEIDLGPPERRS